jgi:DNA polymerase V
MSSIKPDELAFASEPVKPSAGNVRALFALADCNNFFVSCERVFDPRLEGIPVVVLSNNDACAISCSNEAKKLGIKVGMPVFEAEAVIRKYKIRLVSANFTLYRDLSLRISHCLQQFCPDIEIYSVDEVFMVLKERDGRDIDTLIRKMRQTVHRWTGVPMSIGVAETKTLAKLAAGYAKKEISLGGCFNLSATTPQDRDRVLSHTPVENVWGIGRQYGKWLTSRGITTALRLRDMDESSFERKAGVTGLRTVKELKGIPCISIDLDDTPRKTITCSRSFGSPVTDHRELKEAIAAFTSQAARELRYDGSLARKVTVYCRSKSGLGNAPASDSMTISLPVPTYRDIDLISAAFTCLERIYRPGLIYRKAGITLNDISGRDVRQTDMFAEIEHNRLDSLNEVIDRLNSRWGYGTIKYAVAGTKKRWKSLSALRSPNYTTQWNDLPICTFADFQSAENYDV